MLGFNGGVPGSMLLAGVSLLSLSCAKGVLDAGDERADAAATGDPVNVADAGDVSWDVDSNTGTDAGPCDGVTDCGCSQDSDGDGSNDCEDDCPFSANVGLSVWYPDCDGDGQAGPSAVAVCGADPPSSACKDGQLPDGGFLAGPGSDCDDEQRAALVEGDYYPDCDGDGAPGALAIRSCGLLGASAIFDCADGKDPAGGFWSIKGTDCDDESVLATKLGSVYADCDGDGVAASAPIPSCGARPVSKVSPCGDEKAPDGGYWSVPGTDCNDESLGITAVTNWYADCDGDGESSGEPTSSCGSPVVALTTCLDGQLPDGGYDKVAGVDCNDELASNPCRCGFQDDDGDGVCTLLVARSCLQHLQRDPLAADGTYQIDPDGSTSTPVVNVSCDMSGGGWTVIARDDFSAGAAGWHAPAGTPSPVDATACTTAFSPFLGGPQAFGAGATTLKSFALLGVPHTELSVKLDYIVIDSWDGEDALIHVDSVERFRAAFNAAPAATNLCGGGWRDVGRQPVSLQFGHTENTATVSITSTLNSPAADESFGVDSVLIRVR